MAGESSRATSKRLRQSAESWGPGVEAAEATATALMALPPSWTVLSDLDWPGSRHANIDHVLVGPPGVFVVDSELWAGQVTLEDAVLQHDGRDGRPVVRDAASAAKSLASLVASVRADHVQAVVCLAEADSPVGWVDGVLVRPSTRLVDELTGYPQVLPGGLAQAVGRDVDRRLHRAERSRSAKKPGTRRRPYAALVLGVLAIAVAVGMLSQPDPLVSFVDDILDWVGTLGR